MPTSASYISQGQSAAGMGQRPNKINTSMTGGSKSLSARPSLLGGR
jgi:hypothetical protein